VAFVSPDAEGTMTLPGGSEDGFSFFFLSFTARSLEFPLRGASVSLWMPVAVSPCLASLVASLPASFLFLSSLRASSSLFSLLLFFDEASPSFPLFSLSPSASRRFSSGWFDDETLAGTTTTGALKDDVFPDGSPPMDADLARWSPP